MLQGKGIIEDVGVGEVWGGLTDFLQEGAAVRALESGSLRLMAGVWQLTVEIQGWQQRQQRVLPGRMWPS